MSQTHRCNFVVKPLVLLFSGVYRNQEANDMWSEVYNNSTKVENKRKVKKSTADSTNSIDDINSKDSDIDLTPITLNNETI